VAPQGGFDRDDWRGGRHPRYGDGSHLPPGWMQGSRPAAPPERPPRVPAHAERPAPSQPPVPQAGFTAPRPPVHNNLGSYEPSPAQGPRPGHRPRPLPIA
jgi:hypothetical protein